MANIRNSAKALILKDGRLLLNRCKTGSGEEYFDLPGGGQHVYEAMEEAVVREVLEETGLMVEPVRFAALCEEIFTDPDMRRRYPEYCHRTLHIFLARVTSHTIGERSETDFQQTGSLWVTPEEAESLPIVPLQLRGRVREILSAEGPVYLGTVRRDEVCM